MYTLKNVLTKENVIIYIYSKYINKYTLQYNELYLLEIMFGMFKRYEGIQ